MASLRMCYLAGTSRQIRPWQAHGGLLSQALKVLKYLHTTSSMYFFGAAMPSYLGHCVYVMLKTNVSLYASSRHSACSAPNSARVHEAFTSLLTKQPLVVTQVTAMGKGPASWNHSMLLVTTNGRVMKR